MRILSPVTIPGKIFVQVCVFFYLYSVQFNGIPFHIGTRIILSASGLLILLFNCIKQLDHRKDIFISRDLVGYMIAFLVLSSFSIACIFLNGTSDIEFVKYPLSLVFILLAGYCIYFMLKKVYKQVTYEIIMYHIIIAVLIQVVLSLTSFLSPLVNDILISIQYVSDQDISKIEETTGFRLIGFGSTFFGSGIVNGYALMLIAVLLKKKTAGRLQVFFLSFLFLVIFVLGMMMARTTLVGFILAIIYLLVPSYYFNKKILRNKRRFFINLVLIPVITFSMITFLFPKTIENIEAAANFGFEIFINYSESGELESASTSRLKEMYVFPSHPKTYIIGDGKYYEQPGNPASGYYMNTDVGFLRLIYYFGLIGMLLYFSLQFLVIKNAVRRNSYYADVKKFLLLSFMYCIILNFKGFTDIFFLSIMFCFPGTAAKPAAYSQILGETTV